MYLLPYHKFYKYRFETYVRSCNILNGVTVRRINKQTARLCLDVLVNIIETCAYINVEHVR